MLSVGKVTAANAGYWQDAVAQGREDYYSGAGEAPGQWVGRADQLGRIAGETVTAVESALLLEALSAPDGTVLGQKVSTKVTNAGTPLEKTLHPVTAHDLTFSAPKGVSTLWAVGGDRVGAEIEAAQTAAIDAVLGWLDRNAMFTRTGKDGVNVADVDGLIGIVYRHRTSRALDPQLHDHVLVANIGRTSRDGKWRRLDGRALYKAAKQAGMIYQAALRAELVKRLGVEFGRVDDNGQADIVGIDERLIDRWSTRGKEIDARLDAWTEEFAVANDRAPTPTERRTAHQTIVLATRPPKPQGSHATDTLHDRWTSEARAAGVDVEAMVNDVCGRQRPDRARPSADAAVVEVARLQAAWTPAQLAGTVARGLQGMPDAATVVAVVEKITADALASAAVVELTATEQPDNDIGRRRDGRRVDEVPTAIRFASSQHLQLEHEVIEWAARPQQEHRFEAVTAADVAGLDSSQAVAAAALVRSVRPVHLVVGPAGAGKTTMLARAVDMWRRDGIDVVGMAPAAGAATKLGEGAGVSHDTLDMFLKQQRNALPASALREGMTSSARMRSGSVVLVDEAAMASTAQLHALATIATRDRLRVVLVGDHRQLAAVEVGGMFEAIAADTSGNVSVLELDHIHRFNESWEADASTRLRAGDTTVVDEYNQRGRIDIHPGRDAALDQLADTAATDLINGVDTLTMAHRNVDVADLNDRIVDRLVDAGHLPAWTVPTAGREWRLGEHVVTRRNDRKLSTTTADWVRNGDRWTIELLHGDEGGLTLNSLDEPGRHLRVHADYMINNLERGYATTVHRAQGATVDRGQLYTTPNMPAAALYVGLTRGRKDNQIHTHTDHDHVDDHQAEADLERTAPDPLDPIRTTVGRIDDGQAAITVHRKHATALQQQRAEQKRQDSMVSTSPKQRPGPHLDSGRAPERER